MKIKNDGGYLLVSTLFVLLLSGIMAESIIRISRNHIIQLNQLSQSYEEKAALNLAEKILVDKIAQEEQEINEVSFISSLGRIEAKKKKNLSYDLILRKENGEESRRLIEILEAKEDKKEK